MTSSRSPLGRACAAALIVVAGLFSAPALRAAEGPGASGVVEGRVLHGGSGDYLENARVALEGTNLEALTNEFGEFRLIGVTAGTVTGLLQVFSQISPDTGLPDPVAFTKGVALALSATVIGLCIAIPSLVGSGYLQRKIENYAAQLDVLLERILQRKPGAQ